MQNINNIWRVGGGVYTGTICMAAKVGNCSLVRNDSGDEFLARRCLPYSPWMTDQSIRVLPGISVSLDEYVACR